MGGIGIPSERKEERKRGAGERKEGRKRERKRRGEERKHGRRSVGAGGWFWEPELVQHVSGKRLGCKTRTRVYNCGSQAKMLLRSLLSNRASWRLEESSKAASVVLQTGSSLFLN